MKIIYIVRKLLFFKTTDLYTLKDLKKHFKLMKENINKIFLNTRTAKTLSTLKLF